MRIYATKEQLMKWNEEGNLPENAHIVVVEEITLMQHLANSYEYVRRIAKYKKDAIKQNGIVKKAKEVLETIDRKTGNLAEVVGEVGAMSLSAGLIYGMITTPAGAMITNGLVTIGLLLVVGYGGGKLVQRAIQGAAWIYNRVRNPEPMAC